MQKFVFMQPKGIIVENQPILEKESSFGCRWGRLLVSNYKQNDICSKYGADFLPYI